MLAKNLSINHKYFYVDGPRLRRFNNSSRPLEGVGSFKCGALEDAD